MSMERKDGRVAPAILVVSDDADEVRNTRELLQADNKNIFGADSMEAGLSMFQEHLPILLVLAFLDLEKSERFYLMLHRQCPTIKETRHQTLLLCKSNETEAAFSLCRNGTLDDYLVNRPMHDPFRLRLAAQQALTRQLGDTQSGALNRQLSHIGSDLRHLDSFVKQALAAGQGCQAESLKEFREFAGRLSRELDQFDARMKDSSLGEAATLIERSGLRQQFDELRRNAVEPATRQVEGKLQEAQHWARQLDEGYREHAAWVEKVDFPPRQAEVMLVDDDEVYREMLGAILEEIGLRALMFDGGEAALAVMRRRRPDIVLLDYKMPGIGGLATLKRMKNDETLKDIPVVMLTGVKDRDVVREVIMAGAAGYIVKPSNRPIIVAKIRDLLEGTTETHEGE